MLIINQRLCVIWKYWKIYFSVHRYVAFIQNRVLWKIKAELTSHSFQPILHKKWRQQRNCNTRSNTEGKYAEKADIYSPHLLARSHILDLLRVERLLVTVRFSVIGKPRSCSSIHGQSSDRDSLLPAGYAGGLVTTMDNRQGTSQSVSHRTIIISNYMHNSSHNNEILYAMYVLMIFS